MACGRPVVATRVGGPPEFVPPDAGILVDPLDVDGDRRGAPRGRGAARARTRRPAPPPRATTCGARPSGSRPSSAAPPRRARRAAAGRPSVGDLLPSRSTEVDEPPDDRAERRADQVDPEARPLGSRRAPGRSYRAGLTDEPLNGISAKWIASSVSGIATSAVPPKLRSSSMEDDEHEDRRER